MYTAHIRSDKTEQTVKTHLADTSYRCAQSGRKLGLSKTAELTGLIHDFGKFSNEFQKYLRYSATHPEDKSLRGKVIHATQGAKYINEKGIDGDAVSRVTATAIALAVASHHGSLMDCITPEGVPALSQRLAGEDSRLHYNEARKKYESLCFPLSRIDVLWNAAKEEIQEVLAYIKSRGLDGRFTMHLIVKSLFSCLVDADRYDTYLFMAGLSANTGLDESIPPWKALSRRLDAHIAELPASHPIDLLRHDISLSCQRFGAREKGIYRLSVPTGGGKTLSSLRFALAHAQRHQMERIFYIIPYTSIIDQNAEEIRRILKRDDLILEHHSNLIRDEEDDTYELLTERWDIPIIFTTSVQFLNSLYASGSRQLRRLHQLANAVLIFDEIQSIPLSCIHLFNGALNFLSVVGGSTIVLCTATQPLLDRTERPLLQSHDAEMIRDVSSVFLQFKRTRLVDTCVDGGYSGEELCGFTLKKMNDLRTGLVILNTKKDAMRLFRDICLRNEHLPPQKQYTIYHLSTNMCPAHRKKILKKIKERLEHDRIICISTQLIEAGVNLSFQCVIRALAGLDSIAQAAGRCNRHGEDDCRDVYIVNMRNEHIENLPSIKTGQEATERILQEMRADPGAYGGDLLSPEAISQYYFYYFYQNKDLMDYLIPGSSESIYDWLSCNQMGRGEYARRYPGMAIPPLVQAFASAGKAFHVIEDNTTSLLVPYEEGKALIADISAQHDLSKTKTLLRRAQQYSVEVFDHTLRAMERENAIYLLPCGLLALRPGYYSGETGITTLQGAMDTLIC